MKIKIQQEIIKKKASKTEFAILTNLNNGDTGIFEKDKKLSKNLSKTLSAPLSGHFGKSIVGENYLTCT